FSLSVLATTLVCTQAYYTNLNSDEAMNIMPYPSNGAGQYGEVRSLPYYNSDVVRAQPYYGGSSGNGINTAQYPRSGNN
ncbi:hypothetical protein PMAYCL1PPCAC_09116, partial [Pristionchus mayeri]